MWRTLPHWWIDGTRLIGVQLRASDHVISSRSAARRSLDFLSAKRFRLTGRCADADRQMTREGFLPLQSDWLNSKEGHAVLV
jgi:hypothetical protein